MDVAVVNEEQEEVEKEEEDNYHDGRYCDGGGLCIFCGSFRLITRRST